MSSYILFPTAAIPKIYYSNTSKVDSILIKEALITLQKRNVSTFFFLDCTLFAVLHSFFINVFSDLSVPRANSVANKEECIQSQSIKYHCRGMQGCKRRLLLFQEKREGTQCGCKAVAIRNRPFRFHKSHCRRKETCQ